MHQPNRLPLSIVVAIALCGVTVFAQRRGGDDSVEQASTATPTSKLTCRSVRGHVTESWR